MAIYILFEQDYEDMFFIGYVDTEEEAKKYIEYTGSRYATYEKLDKLISKT
jgi:lipoate-protein ligase A